jgi:enoyl-CoA hydratase/carnithine racemase
MTSLVLVERRDNIVTLTLNAPERRNPISDLDMVDALVAALEDANRDIDVRAVVLTGAGPGFSSGGDIKKFGPGQGLRGAYPAETRSNYKAGIQRLPLLFQSLDVAVIAAVNGPAVGAGCDLACMCDIRIAGTSARFAESFVKVGLIPGDGGAWLLPRIVGFARATEMALTGEMIDADTALAIGLVSRVVPDADLQGAALDMAGRIAVNSPHATRMTKRLLREAQTATLASTLELSAAFQALVHDTADHEEAMAAVRERRQPTYRGR